VLPAATALAPVTLVAPAKVVAPAIVVAPARPIPPPPPNPITICAWGLLGTDRHSRPAIKLDANCFDALAILPFILRSSLFMIFDLFHRPAL
jgi:hypothetical protein